MDQNALKKLVGAKNNGTSAITVSNIFWEIIFNFKA